MKKLRENLALDLKKEKEIFSSSTGLPTYAVDVLINNAGKLANKIMRSYGVIEL